MIYTTDSVFFLQFLKNQVQIHDKYDDLFKERIEKLKLIYKM